ncbi:MAG: hypothetical protein IPG07_22155, partial [Crocinitomicaceae bacterium]|nr:hypothetical protein [Crocinitomicaceae bacterium]
ITTYFTSNPACTSTINSTAPPSCACNVDIGTYNANITGSSPNNYVLCFGDQIDINSNMDFTAPAEQFAPPDLLTIRAALLIIFTSANSGNLLLIWLSLFQMIPPA